MRITANTQDCVGSGQCALIAGSVFDQGEDGLVTVLQPEPSEAEAPLARRAASLCPGQAIVVTE